MRLSQPPPSLLSLLVLLLTHANSATATPFLNSELHDIDYSFLEGRDCALYCGLGGRYCCDVGQGCFTDAQSIAYCSSTAGNAAPAQTGGGFAVYTTTWTETDLVTRTSTYSSWFPVAAAPTTQAWVPVNTAGPAICTLSAETSCGAICCAGNQYCASAGQCSALSSSWTYVAPTSTVASYSAPLRPTSGGVVTATATTTMPFVAPVTASGTSLPVTVVSSHSLSPGAIAGIVIGVLAAIILLLLLCFCCIVKAGFDGLLGLFGLGKRRRRTDRVYTEETVERYSRHGSGAGSQRPGVVVDNVSTRKKKSSGFGGMGAVGAGLLGLAVVLGLKRKHDRNEKPARSHVSSSYGSYTTTESSQSSASSDRRTRESRRH